MGALPGSPPVTRGRIIVSSRTTLGEATHAHGCDCGLKLYLLTTAEGMPVAWYLADRKLGEREAAAGLPVALDAGSHGEQALGDPSGT